MKNFLLCFLFSLTFIPQIGSSNDCNELENIMSPSVDLYDRLQFLREYPDLTERCYIDSEAVVSQRQQVIKAIFYPEELIDAASKELKQLEENLKELVTDKKEIRLKTKL